MRWIGAIRSKAEVETRMEDVEFEYPVLMSKPWGENGDRSSGYSRLV